MFEQLLKEMILKMINEDPDIRSVLWKTMMENYDMVISRSVKHIIENDESVQDVIRKQATTDIWEAIEDDVDAAIDKTFEDLIVVRR